MRLLGLTTAFLLCLLLIFAAGREGLSQLESAYGRAFGSITHVNAAVTLSPSNPEARYARATILYSQGEFGEASSQLANAISLRPRDYFLWLELGHAREQVNDQQGALVAFQEAVRLAPYYAQPRWQLGNLLLRLGRYDEAFDELKRAVRSDPTLMPGFIDLAWSVYNGDANSAIRAKAFEGVTERMALMHALVKKKNISAAMLLLRSGTPITTPDRNLLVGELINSQRFGEAYELWANARRETGFGAIVNGDFENEIIQDNPGFGWRLTSPVESVVFTIDSSEPYSGSNSLRLEFGGDPDPNLPIISQIILVEPATRYRLSFAARTAALVTAGQPFFTVSGARKPNRMLGEARTIPQGTNNWQKFEIDFVASGTDAVVITLQRRQCRDAMCPIFGRMWLDDFSLRKL